jgi:hypothetical protein
MWQRRASCAIHETHAVCQTTTTNVVAVAAATITTTIVTATTSAAGTFPSRSAIVHDDEITKIVVSVRNQLFAV